MSEADLRRDDEALAWVRRIADPDFADWDGHLEWLERDPANPAAFDRALLLIEEGTSGLTLVPRRGEAANDNAARLHRRRLGWLAGAVALAASIAALIAYKPPARRQDGRYVVVTAAGELRTLTLADGTRLILNGSTRIVLDRADGRAARLERGEAFFAVRHDPRRPFSVSAGPATFQDVGTAFDVREVGGFTELAVRDGAVMFDPTHAAVRLDKGQAVTITAGTAVVHQIDPAAVGAWRGGRLIYRDAPLPVIAGDIERTTGTPVSVDNSLSERRFSGVLILTADRSAMFARIGAVMDVVAEREGKGWRLRQPAR